MAPSHSSLHFLPFLTTIVMITTSTQHVLNRTRSRVSQQGKNHRKSHPQRDQRKTKIRSRPLLPCLQAIMSTNLPFSCNDLVVTGSRTPKEDSRGHRILARQDRDNVFFKPTLLSLQAIKIIVACIHCVLLAFPLVSRQNSPDRQLNLQSALGNIMRRHKNQHAGRSKYLSAAIPAPMHWIRFPATYPMMQHQSHVALYRESAQANTYVPTPTPLTVIRCNH